MTLRRLSGGCDDKLTCPGLWEDDDHPEEVIVVGKEVKRSSLPLGVGEKAVSLPKLVVREAELGI